MSPIIGAPIDRLDGPLKVTGRARYSAEVQVENLAHGVLVQSTIAKGRIARIDSRRAEAAPGVLGILTHLNAPRLGTPSFPPAAQSFMLLQGDIVHYSGQHVAVVVAETLEQARHAATLLEIDYVAEPPTATLADGLDRAFAPKPFGGRSPDITRGDPDGGLAEAAMRIDATYTTPVHHHNPMEPSASVALWAGDRLTLYESAQGISYTKAVVAGLLGMPPENVRVVSHFLGGGFGCKGFLWPHTTLTAVAARHVGRPVKLVLTRSQMFTSHGRRSDVVQRMRLGATRDGRLTAIVHAATSHTPPFDEFPWSAGEPTSLMLYACPNVALIRRLVRVNVGNPTPTRSPIAPAVYALESALDELASALGIDPLELRLRNHADADPRTGESWGSSKFLKECYALGAARFGWERRSPTPGSMRDGDSLVGWEMASAVHPYYGGAAAATARLSADGLALVRCGTQEIGTGTYTVMTQVAADALGLPVGRVRFELGDTNLPEAPLSAGSATVGSVGPAVHAACAAARSALVRLALADAASPLRGADEAQVGAEDGRLFLTHDPARGEAHADILARHALEMIEGKGEAAPGEERRRFSIHSFGAVFAEVRVDPDLGVVRVTRLVGAYDVGRVLNPKTARSQLQGGIIWGLGQALLEHTRTDRNLGRIVTPNLSAYLLPVHADVPDIDVHFVDGFDPYTNPLGTKNIGEVGPIGVPAAIANAVYHATGRRVRDFPITPDKLL